MLTKTRTAWIVLASAAAVAGCQHTRPNAQQASRIGAPDSKTTATFASVSSGVSGTVKKVMIVPGQVLKPGDSLFQLEVSEQESPTPTEIGSRTEERMISTFAEKASRLRSQIQRDHNEVPEPSSRDTTETVTAAYLLTLDVLAHNLANLNTVGFKRSRVNFQEFTEATSTHPGSHEHVNVQVHQTVWERRHVQQPNVCRVFTTGRLSETGEKMDVAIQGEGFLEVQLPDGSRAYTRDGALRIDANGQVTTLNGFKVLGGWPILHLGTTSVSVSPTGQATTGDPKGAQSFQLHLARFKTPSELESCDHNLFRETTGSGPAQLGLPGEPGFGTLQQGYLEQSTVDLATELQELIRVEQAYSVLLRIADAKQRVAQVKAPSTIGHSGVPWAIAPSAR